MPFPITLPMTGTPVTKLARPPKTVPKYPGLENISEAEYLSNISYKGLMKRIEASKEKFSENKKNEYIIQASLI